MSGLTSGNHDLRNYYWLPILAFESVLCGMALWKGLQVVKTRDWRRSKLSVLAYLVRDSLCYFIAVFSVYLLNFVLWKVNDRRLEEIPVGFTVAISTTMIQRLLFNVRHNFNASRVHSERGTELSVLSGSSHSRGASVTLVAPAELVGTSKPKRISQAQAQAAERYSSIDGIFSSQQHRISIIS